MRPTPGRGKGSAMLFITPRGARHAHTRRHTDIRHGTPIMMMMMIFITSENCSAPLHDTHRHKSREAGRGGTVRARLSGALLESYWVAWWACSTARSAGPFVGMSLGGGGQRGRYGRGEMFSSAPRP